MASNCKNRSNRRNNCVSAKLAKAVRTCSVHVHVWNSWSQGKSSIPTGWHNANTHAAYYLGRRSIQINSFPLHAYAKKLYKHVIKYCTSLDDSPSYVLFNTGEPHYLFDRIEPCKWFSNKNEHIGGPHCAQSVSTSRNAYTRVRRLRTRLYNSDSMYCNASEKATT